MERRELKFKRHHFYFNGDYIQSTEWGIFDYGFRSPSSFSNEDKDKFIDCQFTGLKDKNGVDIYEGDILKVPDDYDTYGFMAGEERGIVFLDGGFRFKSKIKSHRGHWLEDSREYEITGNIHQLNTPKNEENDNR